jgi:hypothetical protein
MCAEGLARTACLSVGGVMRDAAVSTTAKPSTVTRYPRGIARHPIECHAKPIGSSLQASGLICLWGNNMSGLIHSALWFLSRIWST